MVTSTRKHITAWHYFALMSLLSCTPDEQPRTPDVHALDCYSRVRYPSLLSDVERPHVDDARQQYAADVSKGILPDGCWAGDKPKCNTECE